MTPLDKFHEGLRLQHGIGVDADPAAAAECFRVAGAAGHTPSLVRLGIMLTDDEGEFYPKSLEAATDAFQRAAEGGNPRAFFHLALGLYKRKLLSEAMELFQKAADLGELTSMLYIGDAYANGVGLPRDLQKAFDCYLNGALAGQVDAACNLARLVPNEPVFHSFAPLVYGLLEPGRQLENPRAWTETGCPAQSH